MEETLKLLVVDDEPDNLDLLYRTFRKRLSSIQSKKWRRGARSFKLCSRRDGHYYLRISVMPKMNGTEFFKLYRCKRFPDTIRMVLTGYTDV